MMPIPLANNNANITISIVFMFILIFNSLKHRKKSGEEQKAFFIIIDIFVLTLFLIALYLTWS
jgi:hypothetical protein